MMMMIMDGIQYSLDFHAEFFIAFVTKTDKSGHAITSLDYYYYYSRDHFSL